MVGSILQPSTVTKMGDEYKLARSVNVGLTKGGPASPMLYNKTETVLITHVLYAFQIDDVGNCPALLKAFFDDIELQLARSVATVIVLRAACSGRIGY